MGTSKKQREWYERYSISKASKQLTRDIKKLVRDAKRDLKK